MTGTLPLSLALAGLELEPAMRVPVRAGVERAQRSGLRWVQLDAASREVRARDLDRSARRDLAGVLRRGEVSCSGLDLWIPPEHFARTETVDRAVSAVVEAISLASDLGSLLSPEARRVSIELPGDAPEGLRRELGSAGERRGVAVCDHSMPVEENTLAAPGLVAGIDPARALIAGGDPAALASRLASGGLLGSARLSDLSGAGRVAPGSGRLDVLSYRMMLETSGHHAPVVLDLLQVRAPIEAIGDAASAWDPLAS
ncbi:MAG: hypothetical protein ACF8SC_06915 [Phycisphaerales bacterium JB037]